MFRTTLPSNISRQILKTKTSSRPQLCTLQTTVLKRKTIVQSNKNEVFLRQTKTITRFHSSSATATATMATTSSTPFNESTTNALSKSFFFQSTWQKIKKKAILF